MLTKKQRELLLFIQQRLDKTGVTPSFEEMKEALDLRSKSGIHRLITALEERGFIRRLPHRARAIEIVKLPEDQFGKIVDFAQAKAKMDMPAPEADIEHLDVMGRIAAGVPIAAIENVVDRIAVPKALMRSTGKHFILEVQGQSMIEAGINDGDYVIIKEQPDAGNGDIVVALIDEEEATLKRIRKQGDRIALEAANPAFETRILSSDKVRVQGTLVGLMRQY